MDSKKRGESGGWDLNPRGLTSSCVYSISLLPHTAETDSGSAISQTRPHRIPALVNGLSRPPPRARIAFSLPRARIVPASRPQPLQLLPPLLGQRLGRQAALTLDPGGIVGVGGV